MSKTRNCKDLVAKQGGFTLIELMIVVAIVAILTIVATSGYRKQVVRSNRAAAQGYMLELANREERYLLDARKYAVGSGALTALTGSPTPPDEVADNYSVTIADADGNAATPDYLITATATGSQDSSDTDCGNLTLSNQGAKGTELGGSRCWR